MAVYVGDAHAVRIDEHEFLDAGTHQAFGTLAADSAESKNDDAFLVDIVHNIVSEKERCAVENAFFNTHDELCGESARITRKVERLS